jgi:hypothetical protein
MELGLVSAHARPGGEDIIEAKEVDVKIPA